MKKLVIIGFGRFGQLLADIAREEFELQIVEVAEPLQNLAHERGYTVIPLSDVSGADYICLAVPISSFEQTLRAIAPLVRPHQTVLDMCSIKVYPAELMQQYLPHCQTLATHPLFGPDSARHGLNGLQVVLCPLTIGEANLKTWRDFWTDQGVEVVIATPDEHDRDSVYSQAFTYSVARLINEMEIPKLKFTTKSYRDLKEVADLSAKDSEQLFHDMLFYNPYFPEMKAQLEAATKRTLAKLNEIADGQ